MVLSSDRWISGRLAAISKSDRPLGRERKYLVALMLARIGRFAFRRRGPVLLIWLALLAGVVAAAMTAPEAPEEEFSMPGIESRQAFDLIQDRFPGAAADGAEATVVFVAPEGDTVTSTTARSAIRGAVDDIADGEQVASMEDPFQSGAVSDDKSAAYASVVYTVEADGVSDESRQEVKDAVDAGRAAGLTVESGGSALEAGGGPGGVAEAVAISVAALILFITFGSLVAAGLPLLTALIGVGVSVMSIMALSEPLGLSSLTNQLAIMLGLAVGIDYALFVVSRYREERGRGHEAGEAVFRAVGTAGSAVVFAGLTVVIALAGLLVVGIPVLSKMGMAAAGAVVVAVLIALTLVPAVLGFVPDKVLSRSKRRRGSPGADAIEVDETSKAENGGAKWAGFVLRHPLPVLVVGVVALGALAIPATGLQLGMPGDESKSTETTERRAYDELADAFGPGFNGPLTIVVDAKDAENVEGAAATIKKNIAANEGIVSVSESQLNDSGDTAVFSAVPTTSPTDEATKSLVRDLRDARSQIQEGTGATFQVTGTTAMDIDVADEVQAALWPYLATVIGLAILLLLVVFRSVLIPLTAALGFLLSVLAALGAVVLIFQDGNFASLLGVEQTGPIMSLVPIFLVGIVFGLAMDYQVFLVSRIREAHVRGEEPRQAIVTGFSRSARVVVAAALIMMAVFGGFIAEKEPLIKMIGFGLAAAVFLDAFVVRMALVPAALALLGRRAWRIPGWLDRVLPRVDVEGESLGRRPSQ